MEDEVGERGRQRSPTVARWELSQRLAERRQSLGVPVAKITEVLGISRTRWSQIENDHTMIAPGSLREIGDLLDFGEVELSELETLRKAGRKANSSWWQQYDDIVNPTLLRYYGLEQGASSLTGYCATIVNGLIQTREYAETLISVNPEVSLFDRHRLLDLRLHRQEQLREGAGLKVNLLLFEPVLMYDLGSRHILIEQLDHIASLVEEMPDTLSIRVLPLNSPPTGVAGASNFALLDFESPHLHTVVWEEDVRGRLVDDDEESAQFQRLIFSQAEAESLDREKSLELMQQMSKDLRDA